MVNLICGAWLRRTRHLKWFWSNKKPERLPAKIDAFPCKKREGLPARIKTKW
jgi:hypothetical protein